MFRCEKHKKRVFKLCWSLFEIESLQKGKINAGIKEIRDETRHNEFILVHRTIRDYVWSPRT